MPCPAFGSPPERSPATHGMRHEHAVLRRDILQLPRHARCLALRHGARVAEALAHCHVRDGGERGVDAEAHVHHLAIPYKKTGSNPCKTVGTIE